MVIAALVVLGNAGLIIGIAYLFSPHEPTYQGKTLSEWIAPFCRQTAKGLDEPAGPEHFEELQPTRRAVAQIGTNALPFLIARLNYRESRLYRAARELSEKQPIAGLRLTDPNVSKIRAVRALAILGPAAEPAIPSLAAQLTNGAVSLHAVYALSGISNKGMSALVEQYTNVPVTVRMQIAMVIVSPMSMYRGKNATSATYATDPAGFATTIEGLCRVAQDRTMGFRVFAIQRLGEFGPKATNAVPVLMKILANHDSMALPSAIRALGQIKSDPDVVVPALINVLNKHDPGTQLAAAESLRAFGFKVPIPFPSQVPHPIWPIAPGRTNEFRSL
jgi:hypothetical protein